MSEKLQVNALVMTRTLNVDENGKEVASFAIRADYDIITKHGNIPKSKVVTDVIPADQLKLAVEFLSGIEEVLAMSDGIRVNSLDPVT
jgi:hypothetical protein